MKPWRSLAAVWKLHVSGELAHAMDYLEAKGFTFCVDYGTLNAVQIATDLWLQEIESKESNRSKKGR